MSRLPIPGSDNGTWGDILNDFLGVEHNTDGTLKASGSLASKANDSAVVHNSGSETIAGTKTFSSAPIVPSNAFPESAINGLSTDLAAKAADSAVVHNTGAETIAGVKTFSSAPVVPSNAFPESAVNGLTTDLAAKESTANKGAANGYASLDSGTKVPIAQIPTGSTSSTVSLGNHTHTLTFSLAAFSKSGTLTTTTGVQRMPIDGTYTIVGTRLMVGTAPVGSSLIIDVNKNGTTIYTTQANRPAITASSNSGGPGSTPDVTSLAAGDYLTIDIDQVGSTTPGSDLTVTIVVTKTVS